ncbi:MAG: FAD-binding protein [Chloroflexi bacterium]|nr:FAD-binding protein [Chloroflexota bacterium]
MPLSRDGLIAALQEAMGPDAVLHRPYDLMLYEYDGYVERATPDVVVLPRTTEQVVTAVRLANEAGMPFVARGAGTGLSGGAIPTSGGMVISLARMKKILHIDPVNMRAVVQAGVVNSDLGEAVAPHGLQYLPDPSSQRACTIGGNVAENSGGPHCLAYGVTLNHVLGVKMVLPNGEVVTLGSAALDAPGYDLLGLVVGSEGTLGIVTEVTVRLAPLQEDVRTLLAVFDDLQSASRAVSAIIAAGIIPAALEMMDQLALQAIEAYVHVGYPLDAAAVLLIEVEGLSEGLDEQVEQIEEICRAEGARSVRRAQTAEERELLWKGRKSAFGAIGRLSKSYFTQDGVVPRTRLPDVLKEVQAIGQRLGLRILNVFHAGDGNLHPLILFDPDDPDEVARTWKATDEMMAAFVKAGGSITGEHGIGMEKRDYMPMLFSERELDLMQDLRHIFDPAERSNPGKVLPTGRAMTGEATPLHKSRPWSPTS